MHGGENALLVHQLQNSEVSMVKFKAHVLHAICNSEADAESRRCGRYMGRHVLQIMVKVHNVRGLGSSSVLAGRLFLRAKSANVMKEFGNAPSPRAHMLQEERCQSCV